LTSIAGSATLSDRADRDTGCYWRVDFIQPPSPGDERCIMLYGEQGEIVGPLTTSLAEAWMDHFDDRRLATEMVRQAGTAGLLS
jgi:hypothetical protein